MRKAFQRLIVMTFFIFDESHPSAISLIGTTNPCPNRSFASDLRGGVNHSLKSEINLDNGPAKYLIISSLSRIMTVNVRDHELLSGGSGNWFFLEPAFTPLSDEWCAKLLSSGSASTRNLVFVTTTKTPDDQIALWQSHVKPELPARIGFIDLLGFSRRGASESIQTAERDGCQIWIETVQPGNLTKIGIVLSNYLAQWSGEDDCVAVCFDSLTSLLQFAEVRTLYRFIHELTNQVRAVEGLAHYHLDPEAHEAQIVSKFMALFDGVVEPDGEGDWRIRTR